MLQLSHMSAGLLCDLNLTVEAGQVVCLSGPSGSGKTRLLRALADLDPHEGDVSLKDTHQSEVPASQWRRQVMMVPAESQWWYDTVAEHLPEGDDEGWRELGFSDNPLSWEISRLSTGEKQRLALWRALRQSPRALLLDEPTANLDSRSRQLTEQWLLARIRSDGLPVIWVAHDDDQIARVADRHYVIEGSNLKEVPCRSST